MKIVKINVYDLLWVSSISIKTARSYYTRHISTAPLIEMLNRIKL